MRAGRADIEGAPLSHIEAIAPWREPGSGVNLRREADDATG